MHICRMKYDHKINASACYIGDALFINTPFKDVMRLNKLLFCTDSDNESRDGSTTQEKKHGRVSQPINTIAYTVSAYIHA